MPTVTNFGDVVTQGNTTATGNLTVQGTGTSSFTSALSAVTMAGTLAVTGVTTHSSNIVPSSDFVCGIGTAGARFGNIYSANTNIYTIANIFTANIWSANVTNIATFQNSVYHFQNTFSTGFTQTTGIIIPTSTGISGLGGPSLLFANAFLQTANIGSSTAQLSMNVTGNVLVSNSINVANLQCVTANASYMNIITGGYANMASINVFTGANATYLTVQTLANVYGTANIVTSNIQTANIVFANVQNLNVSTGANTTYLVVRTLANVYGTANIVTSNIQTANIVFANVQNLNVSTGANTTYLAVTTLANIFSANIVTSNIQTANIDMANVQSLNVSTGANTTYLAVTTLANVFSANLVTSNIQTANIVTANVQNLNVSTGANTTYLAVTTLANVFSANLVTSNIQTANIVTANVQNLNVSTGANISTLFVQTFANILSSNIVSAFTSNINVAAFANVFTANIYRGNVQTTMNVSGLLSATLLAGNASALSNINASNVTMGILPFRNDGAIGLGATAISINGSVGVNNQYLSSTGTSLQWVGPPAAIFSQVPTSTNQIFYNSGNVAIGVYNWTQFGAGFNTYPGVPLDVYGGAGSFSNVSDANQTGTIRIMQNAANWAANGGLEFKTGTNIAGAGHRIVTTELVSSSGIAPLIFQYRANTPVWSNAMVIHNGSTTPGFVGIGTMAPAFNLHVYQVSNTSPATMTVQMSNTQQSSQLYLSNASGTSTQLYLNGPNLSSDGPVNSATLRNNAGDLRLAAQGTTPYIYLQTSSSNVGINTTTATQSLDVSGYARIGSGSSDTARLILGRAPGTTNFDYASMIESVSTFATNRQSTLKFYTHGTATTGADPTLAMTINPTQQVGIGIAPSYKFHVDNGANNGVNAVVQASTIVAGNTTSMILGKALSTNNSATLTWNHVGEGLATNYLGIGYYGGDNKLCVSAAGNTGIGTTNPQNTLHVSGRTRLVAASETYALAVSYSEASGGLYYIGATNSATPDLVFSPIGGSESVRITNGGDVGIGTNNPAYTLTVYGDNSQGGCIAVTGPTDTTAGYVYKGYAVPSGNTGLRAYLGLSQTNTGTSNIFLWGDQNTIGATISMSTNQYQFWNQTQTSQLMTILSSGNVGIGTNNPGYLLDVWNGGIRSYCSVNGVPTSGIYSTNANSGLNAYATMGLVTDTGGCYFIKNSSTRTTDGGVKTATLRNDDGDLRLAAASTSPYIYLQASSGNVGIGTVTPGNLLHVSGGRTRLVAASETYALGVSYSEASGGRYYIGATNSATPDLVFSQVGGSERMRITDGGNVGIGVTNPGVPLQVNTTNTGTTPGFALYYPALATGGTGVSAFVGTAAASSRCGYIQFQNYGADASNVFNVGMFGGVQMSINTTGVGIGTTNPGSPFNVYNTGGHSATYTSYIQLQNSPTGSAGSTAILYMKSDFLGIEVVDNVSNTAANKKSIVIGEFGGNVGIAYNSPQSILHVQVGDVVPSATGNMTTGLIISQASGGPAMCLGARTTGGNYTWIHSAFTNNSGVTSPLALQPARGYVGIGVTNPIRTFHLNGGEFSFTPSITTAYLNISDSAGNNGGNYTLVIRGLGTAGAAQVGIASFSVVATASSFSGTLSSGAITTTGSVNMTGNATRIQFNATTTWSGDAGTSFGKLEYHAERWYVNAGSNSTLICQFRRGGTDVAYVDNSGNYISTGGATFAGNVSLFGGNSGTNGFTFENQSTFTRIAMRQMRWYDWNGVGDFIYLTNGCVGIRTSQTSSAFEVAGRSYIWGTGNAGGGENRFTGLEVDSNANGRAQLVLNSAYSDMVICSSQTNGNHGSTLSFVTNSTANNDYRKFVIDQNNWGADASGTGGYGDRLCFDWRDAAYPNPHSYVDPGTATMTLYGRGKSVGINNVRTPGYNLHVNGTAYVSTEFYCGSWMRTIGNGGHYWETWGGGWNMTDTTYMRCYGDKYIYTGSVICAGGDIIAYYSDMRLKKNIEPITGAIDKIKTLSTFTYETNDLGESFGLESNVRNTGFSAQEVKEVMPEVIRLAPFDMGEKNDVTGIIESKSGENYMTVQYDKMAPLIVAALKEEVQKREDLEKEVAELKQLVQNLLARQ